MAEFSYYSDCLVDCCGCDKEIAIKLVDPEISVDGSGLVMGMLICRRAANGEFTYDYTLDVAPELVTRPLLAADIDSFSCWLPSNEINAVADVVVPCTTGIEPTIILEDITIGTNTVTVAAFNPATHIILEARIDAALIPGPDGISYAGRRDGNVFTLTGTPNATYSNAFVLELVTRCTL
jgi:hypothetical protein